MQKPTPLQCPPRPLVDSVVLRSALHSHRQQKEKQKPRTEIPEGSCLEGRDPQKYLNVKQKSTFNFCSQRKLDEEEKGWTLGAEGSPPGNTFFPSL